jgi:hypothetical protein
MRAILTLGTPLAYIHATTEIDPKQRKAGILGRIAKLDSPERQG